MGSSEDLTGKQFGRLTVMNFTESIKGWSHWLCKCTCGKYKVVHFRCLKYGATKSCGCLINKDMNLKHGYARRGHISPELVSWHNMKRRCLGEDSRSEKDYKNRGITVCDRWLNSFQNFLDDMGLKPTPNHTIDRIENDKGYYKENCRWATDVEQANNTRRNKFVTLDGITLTVTQWSKQTGVSASTIYYRLDVGWDIKSALYDKATYNRMIRKVDL